MIQSNSDSSLPRSSGVLLHVTSLPGKYGIGDLGSTAFDWIDLLARNHQRWWQILPLNPTGKGNSPYGSFSAFAGNPLLISPELLARDGLLSSADLAPLAGSPASVNYPRVVRHKTALLDRAFEQFTKKRHRLSAAFQSYCSREKLWLDYFALYMALREKFENAPWVRWPKPLVNREPSAMRQARQELAREIDRHRFYQFLFHRQIQNLRQHARKKGVGLIGDLPIFVAHESADVWANPNLFLLDRGGNPKAVAGVPPDYFSKTGQRWGNPLYDWAAMRQANFAWWIDRFRAVLQQTDIVRIDHFRGFAACWTIPASAPDARRGRWTKAPGHALFERVRHALGKLPFIAEDLGIITPDVSKLRDDFNLPGMRVLQFAFGGDSNNPFLPHNYTRNTIAYTGTHDNDTTNSWYRYLSQSERKNLLRYAPAAKQDPAASLIQLAWSSIADLAIAPMQDVLGLSGNSRMNTPGTGEKNWRWRLENLKTAAPALARLSNWTQTYGRDGQS